MVLVRAGSPARTKLGTGMIIYCCKRYAAEPSDILYNGIFQDTSTFLIPEGRHAGEITCAPCEPDS